jgi:hypothetical protein
MKAIKSAAANGMVMKKNYMDGAGVNRSALDNRSVTGERKRTRRGLRRPVALLMLVSAACFWTLPIAAQTDESAGSGRQSAAERGAPEKPEIDLPPVVFEYEAIARQDIDAALPEGSELELPAIEVVLPEPEDLTVEAPAAELDAPRVGTVSAEQESPFFSDGMIGVGLNYSILGDISLYRRGPGPDFSIGFSHEGLDGYGDRLSGSGYFHRREEMNGSVELLEGERGLLRTSVTYTERELGLQNIPDASSLLHRFTKAEVEFESAPGAWGTLRADVQGHIGSRVKAQGDAAEPTRETYLRGRGEWSGRWKWGELALLPGYTFHWGPADEARNAASGKLRGTFYFSGTDLEVSGGAEWWEETGLLYPWKLQLSGILGRALHYTVGGGYEIRLPTYRELWTADPLLDTASQAMEPQHGWRVELDVGYSPAERLEVKAESAWSSWNSYPLPGDVTAADSDDGLFSFSQEPMQTAELLLEGSYTLDSGLSFSASWDGQLLDEDPRRPRALLTLETAYEQQEGRYGARLSSGWELAGEQKMPRIGAEAQYRLGEGVLLLLTGSDLLAPFLEPGRTWWGGYIEPGMNITLKTEISL